MPGKRTDVISWDEFFMRVAMAAAMRSKDPNTQVGACIADANHRILSVGYNGTPSALNDDEFPWETADDPLLDKHSYVIHAEANAILNYRGSNKDLQGATVYVTLFPCHECAKTLVQAGIGEVVYLGDKYEGTQDNLISKRILDTCGVTYRQVTVADWPTGQASPSPMSPREARSQHGRDRRSHPRACMRGGRLPHPRGRGPREHPRGGAAL